MIPSGTSRIAILICVLLFAVSGCGQMGPLSLPDEEPVDDEQSEEENDR